MLISNGVPRLWFFLVSTSNDAISQENEALYVLSIVGDNGIRDSLQQMGFATSPTIKNDQ